MADLHRLTLPLIPHGASPGHRYQAVPDEREQVGGDNTETVRENVLRWASRHRIARLVFAIAAPVQMVIVVLLQALILSNGGDGRALPEYRQCLNDTLQMAIDCSEKANWSNLTIPSFGDDKPFYVGFIIALTVYNAVLCFYALFGKYLCEMIAFLIVNLFTMVYAGVEVHEFRRFSSNCEVPVACQLAIASVVVLCIFTVLFVILVACMWRDLSKKVERDVNHNELLTKYYQWYEVISSGVKLVILFTIVFCVTWMTLLLTPDNYEFGLTIILVVVALVAYFVVQLTIRYNSFAGYLIIAITGIFLLGYNAFKIWRFQTHNCPVCVDQENALKMERDALEWLLQTCTNISNATLSVEINRSIQFDNLYIFASVNMVTTLVVLAIFFGFWCCQPGDELAKHFETNTNPPMIVQVMSCRLKNGSLCENMKKVKKVKVKDLIHEASHWCVRIRKTFSEVFAEAFCSPAKTPCDPVIQEKLM